MSKKPLITVLLPCYNALPFLHEALESITNQTYTNLEILCINDGSTDATAKVLEKYAQKDQRIRLVHNEQNIKLINTLNKGVKLAKGELIARMDADDLCSPNRIERLYQTLIEQNCDIVSCNFDYINVDGSLIRKNKLKPISHNEILFSSFLFTPIGHAMLLGKKSVFTKNNYTFSNDTIHSEDYELWTRMLRNKVTFFNLNEVLYSIRINFESVSFKHEETQIKNFLLNARKHYTLLTKKDVSIEAYSFVVNRFKDSDVSSVKTAFLIIDELASKYGKTIRIKNIVAMQKLDILIQSIRKTTSQKMNFWWLLFVLTCKNAFSISYWTYLNSKRTN